MIAADQFVFGYDDGHRLLAGSRELGGDVLMRLLGATDAAIEPGSPPLVTGLTVPETGEYLFAVTWPAPELPRPGCVWAHALLVGPRALREPRTVDVLLGLPRRPSGDRADLARYTTVAALDDRAPQPPCYLPVGPIDRDVVERVALLAYSPTAGGVVVDGRLDAAASGLLALWRAQWPQLRARFCFRTRAVVTRGPSHYDVTVAAKARGVEESLAAPDGERVPRWVSALVADAESGDGTALRRFLLTFGPQETADPRRLRRLTELWLRINAGDGPAARAQLERFWPRPRAGMALKRALFGADQSDWWDLDERSRVALLGDSPREAFDLRELRLAERAQALS
jgi:hypothetical protein